MFLASKTMRVASPGKVAPELGSKLVAAANS